jgi:polysaccharide export outer membrane protein
VAPATGTLPRTDAYRIGPLDVLEISVFGVPELSGTVEVSDSGNVQLPLLGETSAAGKTAEEVQQDLTSRLGAEYLQNPQVRVTVKEFKSRNVTVSGHIASPGIYPLKGETTLLQIVAMAGGFKEASDSTVLVLRKRGGKRLAARFDVSAIEKGRAEDPLVQPGDTIVAGESTIKKAYQGFLKALPIAGAFMMF